MLLQKGLVLDHKGQDMHCAPLDTALEAQARLPSCLYIAICSHLQNFGTRSQS